MKWLKIYTLCLFFTSFAWLSACSPDSDDGQALRSVADALDPRPNHPESLAAQLQRYRGQAEFVNFAPRRMLAEGVGLGKGQNAEGSRAIQEADLFKVGPKDSHLLYVLNDYRGLQVIDFSQGPEAPRLLSRAPATGDESIEMYFDAANMQLVVLGRRWSADYRMGPQGRLTVYSVAEPEHPRQLASMDVQGDIADSRLVGDVLYVASSRWTYDQTAANGQGWVTSYRLKPGKLEQVQSYALSLPIRSLDTMNIVETFVNGQLKYYLVSILDSIPFIWRDRKSTIELVDISDPKGQVLPVMMVTAKGDIRERSATTIKDGTLIVVSNAWVKDPDGRQIRKVSVESFSLPDEHAKVIDSREAQFRQLWWERSMRSIPHGADPQSYGDLLSRDPLYGLKGWFVKEDDGRLVKTLPDQVVSVGDTSGLHADLQDVRFLGNRLYVFWVPANQVDPLDVFDISRPANELRYLGRTLFEGWMERAIPLQFQGRDFILSLGWIVPALGEGRRQAQAMLFELPHESGEGSPAVTKLDQITLDDPQLWAYFNDTDKTIQVKVQDNGRGLVLFPAYMGGEHYRSGGKIVSFDLAAATGMQLKEGGFLTADASWLRRVFNNPEIDRIHTLTDRSLSTFDTGWDTAATSDRFIESVSTLELARDIVAYTQVQVGGKAYGVQMIARDSMDVLQNQTELRLVAAGDGDAEKARMVLSIELEGRFETFILSKDGDLMVLTTRNIQAVKDDSWQQRFEFHRVHLQAKVGFAPTAQIVSTSWDRNDAMGPIPFIGKFGPWYGWTLPEVFHLEQDRYLIASGRQLRLVQGQGVGLDNKDVSGLLDCLPKDYEDLTIIELGGQLMVSYARPVQSDGTAFAEYRLTKQFMVALDRQTLALVCQNAVNIPGRPLSLQGQKLVTLEDRFLGFESQSLEQDRNGEPRQPMEYQYPYLVQTLTSLRWRGQGASLEDVYALDTARSEVLVSPIGLIFVEQSQEWTPRFLVRLGVDSSLRFVRRGFVMRHAETYVDTRVLKVLPVDERGAAYLVQIGQKASVLQEREDALAPLTLRLQDAAEKEVDEVPLSWWFGYGRESQDRIHYDFPSGRLSLAQGLWGVQQFVIKKGS
jgi:hypothetical protein